MSTLAELWRIREELGLAPENGMIYLGLGFRPPKQNAIALDPDHLPTQRECYAVAGLDVVLIYRGNQTRYGSIRALSGMLEKSLPRRLLLVDLDENRIAFLKMAGL